MWVRATIKKSDLQRLGLTMKEFASLAGRGLWRITTSESPEHVFFEQIPTVGHSGSPADKLLKLTASVHADLWQTVRSDQPYREYYLCALTPSQGKHVLPQILSIYTIMFYLGSITRYNPARFSKIMNSEFAPFVESFINDQPNQFLYLIASQFA